MTLQLKLIPVKRVTNRNEVPSDRSESIQKLALSILVAGGVINPIIVRRSGLENYELVSGYLEYQAARRAREIDPLKGEMIQAFIAESDNEAALCEQVQLLREHPEFASETSSSPPDSKSNNESLNVQSLGELISQENANQIQVFSRVIQQSIADCMRDTLVSFADLPALSAKLTSVEQELKLLRAELALLRGSPRVPQLPAKKVQAAEPVNINVASVRDLRRVDGVGPKLAEKIISRRERNPFRSLEELANVVGLKLYEKQQDQWEELFFV
ncbi:MAG: helix-hairpin-helix domain-containing protein [Gloeomargaritaceae cyanobacterium C42_A2020_066]|nr:helix-hairpin-helix domain-containing protein [Gloeomargaritaceae cyanobacterium C42_A2020_066]